MYQKPIPVLLVVLILFAVADASSLNAHAHGAVINVKASSHAERRGQSSVRFDRRLRAGAGHQGHHGDNLEERAFTSFIDDIVAKTVKMSEKLGRGNQKVADDLFELVKARGLSPNSFEDPLFDQWAKAMTELYKGTAKADEKIIAKMTGAFGDDAVAGVLATATRPMYGSHVPPGTRGLVSRLLDAQVAKWVADGKDADAVLRLLKLDQEGGNLFKNPGINVWGAFAIKADKDGAGDMMFQTLMKHYDEPTLVKMIGAAKTSSDTKEVAHILVDAQLATWRGKNLEDVFKLLKLDEGGATLFKSSAFDMWASFAVKLDKQNADDLMVRSLISHFGDVDLALIVHTGKRSFKWKAFAQRLEEGQFANWMDTHKTVDDVLHLLKLDNEGGQLFRNPVITTWAAYATKLDVRNADDMMYSALKNSYTEQELAKLLVAADLKGPGRPIALRLASKLPSQQTLSLSEASVHDAMVQLTHGGKDIFDGPVFRSWVSFVTKLPKGDENPSKVMLSVLQKQFKDELELAKRVAGLLKQAPEDKTLKELQKLQFQQWRDQGETRNTVAVWVGHEDSRGIPVILGFRDFERGHY